MACLFHKHNSVVYIKPTKWIIMHSSYKQQTTHVSCRQHIYMQYYSTTNSRKHFKYAKETECELLTKKPNWRGKIANSRESNETREKKKQYLFVESNWTISWDAIAQYHFASDDGDDDDDGFGGCCTYYLNASSRARAHMPKTSSRWSPSWRETACVFVPYYVLKNG